jgi:4-aminobutyrate aminotransferase / (S)-3-amino-2-methylpropionate transaminase / 5-aminovalerate transaminase
MASSDSLWPSGGESGQLPPLIRCRPPGPLSLAFSARLEAAESPAFGARRNSRADVAGAEMSPIVYASGEGSNVVDVDGNRYVDLAAGFGALLLGHASPKVARALEVQADRLWMALGDLYPSDVKVALLEKVAALYPAKGARALLGQSGSDAVAAALKTAKLATRKPGVIAFEGAYHGLGYGPLAACGLKKSWREAFADQLNPHVSFVPYPRAARDLDETLSRVEKSLDEGNIGAVLVEPILGRGGCIVPPPAFLGELAGLSKKAEALLISDEIWTGLGRSGDWLAATERGVLPDLVCFGKGLGGGLPISACVGPDAIMQSWRRDRDEEVVHTATFHGAPLACATAIATLDVLAGDRLAERARRVGERARLSLAQALASVPGVGGIRGKGLMIGVELGSASVALAVQRSLLEAGYIVTLGGLAAEVLIVTPALTIAESLFDAFAALLRGLLEGAKGAARTS